MNRVPGSRLALFIVALALFGQLSFGPAWGESAPKSGIGFNYRPQPETNARGTYPSMPGEGSGYSWSSENPDGSRSFQFGRSWSYGNRPPQSAPGQAAQPGWQGGMPNQQQPWQGGPYGQQQPAQGTPAWPGQQGWQSQQPYPQQQPSYGTGSAPRLEVTLQESNAYVHQNLVLTLEVISDITLSTVSVDLPQTEAVVLRELGDTTAQFRTKAGRREIVNQLHYQLTPMQAGDIEIPPLRVSGKNEKGQDYQATAEQSLRLHVLPPDPSVRPWLPLKDLALSAHLLNDEKIAEGQPLTLVVEQKAEGMTGAQLPSLENKLHSKYHRINREKTETDGRISTDGKLIGKRVDHYTLVPQKGNRVEIPAVSVDWWNAVKNRKETAIIPGRLLGSGDLSEKLADMNLSGSISWHIWIPLLFVAFVAGLFWRWLWARSRSLGKPVGRWAGTVSYPLRKELIRLSEKLSPRRQMHRLRRWIANSLPRSFRLWYCVRSADQEQDPDDWAQVLRFLMNRRLGISAQRPMTQLAEDIIALHRGANPDKVRDLMLELEAGLFSKGGAVRDFSQWKKAFKRQIRPNPFRLLKVSGLRRRSRLPELNPSF